MPIYIMVNGLSANLNQNDLLTWITKRIVDPLTSGSHFSTTIYNQLEEIKNEIKELNPRTKRTMGFVQLDLTQSELEKIRENESKEKAESLISQAVTGIYINGSFIPAKHLDPTKQEKDHLKEIDYDPVEIKKLQLTQSPLLCLAQIPNDLRSLCFRDYALFLRQKEPWQAYDQREPGCYGDLFNTEVKINAHIESPDAIKKPLSLEHIIEIQAELSKSVFKKEKTSRSGAVRNVYNLFPVFADTATKEGIIDLLRRIKKDNTLDGFMLGEHKKLNIVSTFCQEMRAQFFDVVLSNIGKEDTSRPTNYEEQYEKFKNTAIEKVLAALTSSGIKVDPSIVKGIILDYLDQHGIENIIKTMEKSAFFWFNCQSLFQDEYAKRLYTSTKAEYEYEIELSRKYALAKADNLSDENIEQRADEILTVIKSTGQINILAPEPQLALKWAEQALDKYNADIQNAKSPDDIIKTIVTLVHELEILHLFHDVNCRTNYFILNEQLQLHGINRTVLYNPNRLDLYSVDQFVEQVKQGIYRFFYIRDHASELSTINKELIENFIDSNLPSYIEPKERSSILSDEDSSYELISKPLQEKIDAFISKLSSSMSDLDAFIKSHTMAPSHPEPRLFTIQDKTHLFCAQMGEILGDFNKTKNMVDFFTRVSILESEDVVPENMKDKFNSHMKQLKEISGYNEKMIASINKLTLK